MEKGCSNLGKCTASSYISPDVEKEKTVLNRRTVF